VKSGECKQVKMSLRGAKKIPRFARNRLCNLIIKGGFDESNPYSLINEIATLPSVVRNDN